MILGIPCSFKSSKNTTQSVISKLEMPKNVFSCSHFTTEFSVVCTFILWELLVTHSNSETFKFLISIHYQFTRYFKWSPDDRFTFIFSHSSVFLWSSIVMFSLMNQTGNPGIGPNLLYICKTNIVQSGLSAFMNIY